MPLGRIVVRLTAVAALALLCGERATSAQVCVGDCDENGRVTITDLTSMVVGVLSDSPRACPTACTGESCLSELVLAVRYALSQCPERQPDGGACAVAADCRSGKCRQRCCSEMCGSGECCDASGACVPPEQCDDAQAPGAPCMDDAECGSGLCDPFDVICCVRRCDTSTEYCTLEGRCREFTGLRSPNGWSCDSDVDCLSSHCDFFDRICCDRRCDPDAEFCLDARCVPFPPPRPVR